MQKVETWKRHLHLKQILIDKRKVKVYFRTMDGIVKRVDATVWAVGEEFVSFKSGISLPVKSVEQVEF